MEYVAYYRVSTDKQGISGLGLEAQKQAVINHLGFTPLQEYVEVESGRKKNRPELGKALNLCKLHGATLVIAKLDRLARNVRFIAELMDSDVEFVACDFPQANRFLLHVMAAVAEHESEMISQRTKAALAAIKARGDGHKLGINGRRLQRRAVEFAEELRETFNDLEGLPYRDIATYLNSKDIPSLSGSLWNATSVMRTIRRLEI